MPPKRPCTPRAAPRCRPAGTARPATTSPITNQTATRSTCKPGAQRARRLPAAAVVEPAAAVVEPATVVVAAAAVVPAIAIVLAVVVVAPVVVPVTVVVPVAVVVPIAAEEPVATEQVAQRFGRQDAAADAEGDLSCPGQEALAAGPLPAG